MDLGLQGQVALVTAASRGLGAAVARRFALEGARVALCSRQLDHAHITVTSPGICNPQSENEWRLGWTSFKSLESFPPLRSS